MILVTFSSRLWCVVFVLSGLCRTHKSHIPHAGGCTWLCLVFASLLLRASFPCRPSPRGQGLCNRFGARPLFLLLKAHFCLIVVVHGPTVSCALPPPLSPLTYLCFSLLFCVCVLFSCLIGGKKAKEATWARRPRSALEFCDVLWCDCAGKSVVRQATKTTASSIWKCCRGVLGCAPTPWSLLGHWFC